MLPEPARLQGSHRSGGRCRRWCRRAVTLLDNGALWLATSRRCAETVGRAARRPAGVPGTAASATTLGAASPLATGYRFAASGFDNNRLTTGNRFATGNRRATGDRLAAPSPTVPRLGCHDGSQDHKHGHGTNNYKASHPKPPWKKTRSGRTARLAVRPQHPLCSVEQ